MFIGSNRNVVGFCLLIVYPASLLNLLAIPELVLFFFPFEVVYVDICGWISWISGKSVHFHLVPDLLDGK
jgi:hypothetical protein